MTIYVLFDDDRVKHFYPLSSTRSIADFRLGIFTIQQKWEKSLGTKVFVFTQDYLQARYLLPDSVHQNVVYINSRYLPTDELIDKIQSLTFSKSLFHQENDAFIAFKTESLFSNIGKLKQHLSDIKVPKEFFKVDLNRFIVHRWDIFQKNHAFIEQDLDIKKKEGVRWIQASQSNQILGSHVYIEEGAVVECSILNSNSGPIYIEKDAEIMEGTMIRGALALCSNATLKMGTKIYGATTIGPHCKIGGEVTNSVIFGYSNKAHDGFLGNSVLGEWCNLGADTNNSNLKNNYGDVSVWDYSSQNYVNTFEQFIGICMGDHAKAGINTMFNTGTVIGCFANVYGADFPEKFIPDFSWGSSGNWQEHNFEKAMEMASKVMQRRKINLSSVERNIYYDVFKQTRIYKAQ